MIATELFLGGIMGDNNGSQRLVNYETILAGLGKLSDDDVATVANVVRELTPVEQEKLVGIDSLQAYAYDSGVEYDDDELETTWESVLRLDGIEVRDDNKVTATSLDKIASTRPAGWPNSEMQRMREDWLANQPWKREQ